MNNSPSTMYYYTHQIAKIVGTSNSSILRWAEVLSGAGYQFERETESGQYRFKEQDIDVLVRFKTYREQERHSLPVCGAKVIEDLKNMLVPLDEAVTTEASTAVSSSLLDDLVREKVREELEPLLIHLQNIQSNMSGVEELRAQLKALPQPPSHDEIRRIAREEEKLRTRITFDVKARLREKAIKIWNEKPDSERMIKVGFFKKIENESMKSDFIRNFIGEHFQQEFDKEYEELGNREQ